MQKHFHNGYGLLSSIFAVYKDQSISLFLCKVKTIWKMNYSAAQELLHLELIYRVRREAALQYTSVGKNQHSTKPCFTKATQTWRARLYGHSVWDFWKRFLEKVVIAFSMEICRKRLKSLKFFKCPMYTDRHRVKYVIALTPHPAALNDVPQRQNSCIKPKNSMWQRGWLSV